MAEYIEREALKQKIAEVQDESGDPISGSQYEIGYHNGLTMAYTLAITAPAADVALVVHGRWIQKDSRNPFSWRTCSECGCVVTAAQARVYVGCPKCLARMDGE